VIPTRAVFFAPSSWVSSAPARRRLRRVCLVGELTYAVVALVVCVLVVDAVRLRQVLAVTVP
jgi:hypothetical protein